ncbi:Pyridoxal-phosphate-dependent serine hydroxymethyltransferase [Gossypium australe]|uniref:Pyridoxal-phosphate-dependent serine hydroxymethyltransferase n=1 Tax=Gossypium australe TaxID=47621 RepID=A0A5B6V5J6_9ROSI|nr:Pyridoxal-phosphate-dependent serine hydroxymethyltransferase [Gossypium australe]
MALNCGVGRAKKKVRQRPKLSMEVFDSTMDGNGQMVQEENVSKDSSILDGNVCMEENFELQDEDVTTEIVNEIRSITFADCVHRFIEKEMALSVMIKLLGRKIVFNTLLNQVSILWNIMGQFQLMDLENDFYLVRFQDKDDLDNVLLGGFWTILVRLSKRYYSNFLFRAIESMIGPVFCIDAKTYATVRGQFTRLAISVDLKKKPLVSKIRIKMGKSRDSSEVRSVSGNNHFGGFKVCCVGGRGEEITADNQVVGKLGLGEERLGLRVNGNGVCENFGLKSIGRVLKPNNGGVGFVSKKNASGSHMGVLLGHEGNDGVLGQENFESVSLKPNLDKLKHTTFRVIEIDSHGTEFGKENNLFNFGATGKEILGEGWNGILEDIINNRKPYDGKLSYNGQPTLDLSSVIEGIMGNLHQDLEQPSVEFSSLAKGESLAAISDRDVGISGFRDDGVINKLGYSDSCRIEANGFFGGIWVFWNDNINVKILGLHCQAVHMWIGNGQNSTGFFCSTIYASLQRNNRHMLWDYLNSMVESCDEPWLIAGYFDSILDMAKGRGDAATFRNGCAHFQEFLFNNGLRDLVVVSLVLHGVEEGYLNVWTGSREF